MIISESVGKYDWYEPCCGMTTTNFQATKKIKEKKLLKGKSVFFQNL